MMLITLHEFGIKSRVHAGGVLKLSERSCVLQRAYAVIVAIFDLVHNHS